MARLIHNPGTAGERAYELRRHVMIGRGPGDPSGDRIEVPDPAVSERHCLITVDAGGRALIRDLSRNGTRLSGLRLQPNVEVPLQAGDEIRISPEHRFVVELQGRSPESERASSATQVIASEKTFVTIVVGDVSGYTTLNRQKDPAAVFPSLSRVMAQLELVVAEHGGSVKEYQGDAIFAYWEAAQGTRSESARAACRAAHALHARVLEISSDSELWAIDDFPLRMEWAVTSGTVLISTLGNDSPRGMAMIGDPVNFAFALEKLATQAHPILLDRPTRELIGDAFPTTALGQRQIGDRRPEEVYALVSDSV